MVIQQHLRLLLVLLECLLEQQLETAVIAREVNPLLGEYLSSAPTHASKTNWRFNDKIQYPRAIQNTSYLRNEVEQILEYPMSCPSVIYSPDCQNNFYAAAASGGGKNGGQNPLMDSACLFEGHAPTALVGTQHYHGLQLRKSPNRGLHIGEGNSNK